MKILIFAVDKMFLKMLLHWLFLLLKSKTSSKSTKPMSVNISSSCCHNYWKARARAFSYLQRNKKYKQNIPS